MAKLCEEVQLGQTALEEMRKSGKNSVKFLFMNLAQVETILSCQ